MAYKVTGTGHPFLQGRKGASHIMAGHALYDRIHKATLMKEIYRLVSIGGHKEVIIIVMSLYDIYNPKRDMAVWK
jgi:hypothetical protein